MATVPCAALIKTKARYHTMTNKNAVAYMRYSTDNQTENSIAYQRAGIAAYCLQNGLTLQDEFVDEARSGNNDRRPALQRMIEASRHNPSWDKILVYDSSRLFRNSTDAAHYKTELHDRGINVISIKEKFPHTTIGWFMEKFTDIVNEFYSRQTRQKTHDGMAVKARKALHCGGIPPLGYDVNCGGNLTINKIEAETVREIFRLYNLGYSYKGMIKILNGKGLTTKTGTPFTKNSFSNILTQEKYIGVYRWNKRKAKNSKGQYNNHAYKPEEEQVIVPGGCPAIVPLEQYQTAQEKLSQRKQGRADTKSRRHYMLGSMKRLKCAKCGAYMAGKVTATHGKKYRVYSCPNHKGGVCPTKDIQAVTLEWYTASRLVNSFQMKQNLPTLNQCLKSGGGNAEAEQFCNRLTGTKKKIANIARALENGYSEELTDRLHQLEQEKRFLTQQVQEATRNIPDINPEDLSELRKNLVRHLVISNDPDVRELLMKHIDEVIVSNEDVTVNLQIG